MKKLYLILFLSFHSHAFVGFESGSFDNLLTKIYWQGKNLTILINGIIIDNKTGDILSFPESTTWEEEDFFTQQSKYCEKGGESDDGAKDEVGM